MKVRYFKVIFIFLFLARFYEMNGQDSARKGYWLTADVHYGFIMPLYTSSMDILIQGHVPAFELDYISKAEGATQWQQTYHFPETGIAVFGAYLSNPLQLGNMYGVYPFINFHLNPNYNEGFYLRVGIGLGYMPVIYNRLDNSKNDVIGSHLDALINLRLNYHFYLSGKTRVETGLGITHCSNGAFHTPDLGLNIITVNTGLSYCINAPKKAATQIYSSHIMDSAKRAQKIQNVFIITAGLSELEPPGGAQYPDYTFSYMLFRKLSLKSKLGIGTDIFYNEANTQRLYDDSVFLKNKLEDVQIGLKAAYELTIGNISLPLEMGGYLYSKYTGNGYVYNRIGVRYYTNRHLILNLSLLTHFARADFIEWGIGYKL